MKVNLVENQADAITKYIMEYKDTIINILENEDDDFLYALITRYFDRHPIEVSVDEDVRLIDAEKLKQCYAGTNGRDNKADYLSIRKMIDVQPTVYNVKKVKEQLEDNIKTVGKEKIILAKDAIHIVENGGIKK